MPDEWNGRIRNFLSGRFDTADLADDDDIFTRGFVNSMFAMELVVFLEECTGVSVPSRDLRLDNFRSVTAMAGLARRLMQTDDRAVTT